MSFDRGFAHLTAGPDRPLFSGQARMLTGEDKNREIEIGLVGNTFTYLRHTPDG